MSSELSSVDEVLETHIPEPYLAEVLPTSIMLFVLFVFVFVFNL